MKKALMLAGLILCVSGVYAAETNPQVADGKKRNEDIYEQKLEQTGWKNEKTEQEQKSRSQSSREQIPPAAQPKSS